jgi:hypothetical protein
MEVTDSGHTTSHNDERTITAGMTMASIAAGTTMAATAIARHIKHGRGTPKVGLYLYLPVSTTIIIALKGPRRPTLL